MQNKNWEKIKKEFDELLDNQFNLNSKSGSYIYHLTRVKEAFEIGTMKLDDFMEIDCDDEWLCNMREEFKNFFKKQFQNQRQEFEDIVKKVEKDIIKEVVGQTFLEKNSSINYNACKEILKELNK